MILLNYAHPLTADQRAQVVALLGVAPEVREVPTHVDRSLPMMEARPAGALAPTSRGDRAGFIRPWCGIYELAGADAYYPNGTTESAFVRGQFWRR